MAKFEQNVLRKVFTILNRNKIKGITLKINFLFLIYLFPIPLLVSIQIVI